MISLNVLFWMYVFLFAIIGAMRGWAKELLVTFSVIVAIFVVSMLEKFPMISQNFTTTDIFWFRSIILLILVFFGYQTPRIPRLVATNRFIREHFQDFLLGLFIGAINGYLIAGTLWYYLDKAGYPFVNIITKPDTMTALGKMIENMVTMMPPAWLLTGQPLAIIDYVVALSFIFVLVVFI